MTKEIKTVLRFAYTLLLLLSLRLFSRHQQQGHIKLEQDATTVHAAHSTHQLMMFDHRTNQIDRGIEEDPDEVNKVPVDRTGFDTPMLFF